MSRSRLLILEGSADASVLRFVLLLDAISLSFSEATARAYNLTESKVASKVLTDSVSVVWSQIGRKLEVAEGNTLDLEVRAKDLDA